MIPAVKKTAVIYVRVSSEEQVENTSLETQETACRRWCAQNGYEIEGVFADRGESAKTADRPAFLRLVEHCRKHKPSAAVAYRIDRWSRNVTDFAVYRSRLSSWSVQMLSATEQITDDPAGRAMAAMLAVFAQFDNDVRAKRTSEGMLATRMRGGWTTRPPRGYATAKTPTGVPSLAPLEPDATAVKDAFATVASGIFGTADLAKRLRIPRRHIRETLSNPAYAGFHLINGERVQGVWPPLVDIQIWEAVQDELLAVWKPKPKANRIFPLRGLLACECGRRLTASSSRSRNGQLHHYYHCTKCGARHRQAKLEAAFDAWLRSMRVHSAPVFRAALLHAKELAADLAKQATAFRVEAEEGRRIAEEKLSRLMDLRCDGEITREQFDAKAKQIKAKHETAEAVSRRLTFSVVDATDIFSAAMELLDDLPRLLANAEGRQRNAILAALVGSNVAVARSGELRTGDSSSVYGLSEHLSGDQNRMAPPTGFEPVLPG